MSRKKKLWIKKYPFFGNCIKPLFILKDKITNIFLKSENVYRNFLPFSFNKCSYIYNVENAIHPIIKND